MNLHISIILLRPPIEKQQNLTPPKAPNKPPPINGKTGPANRDIPQDVNIG